MYSYVFCVCSIMPFQIAETHLFCSFKKLLCMCIRSPNVHIAIKTVLQGRALLLWSLIPHLLYHTWMSWFSQPRKVRWRFLKEMVTKNEARDSKKGFPGLAKAVVTCYGWFCCKSHALFFSRHSVLAIDGTYAYVWHYLQEVRLEIIVLIFLLFSNSKIG